MVAAIRNYLSLYVYIYIYIYIYIYKLCVYILDYFTILLKQCLKYINSTHIIMSRLSSLVWFQRSDHTEDHVSQYLKAVGVRVKDPRVCLGFYSRVTFRQVSIYHVLWNQCQYSLSHTCRFSHHISPKLQRWMKKFESYAMKKIAHFISKSRPLQLLVPHVLHPNQQFYFCCIGLSHMNPDSAELFP